MKIIPHVLYTELELPEFFMLHHEGEKLTLLLSSLQSGNQKLLVNLSAVTPPDEVLSHEATARISHVLLHALENARDPVEMIAIIAPAELTTALRPHVRELESNSYNARLFDDHQQVHLWFGA